MKSKYLKKRSMSALLAVVMVLSAMPAIDVSAAGEEKVIQAESCEPEEAPETEADLSVHRLIEKGEPSEYGYQEMVWVDENGNEIEGEYTYETPGQRRRKARISFPSSYSMKDQGELPSVRNQGQWGTCWAHAVISSVETNMIKKGLIRAEDVDYSERHLAYFAHRRNETDGDGEDDYTEKYGWYGGGNAYQAKGMLANWYGAASEQDYPYASYSTMEDLTESDRKVSVCHLTDASRLSTPEDVKLAVMNTGAVMCSFYTGDGTISTAQGKVYHAEYHKTDHAVSIVGWQDDYARTNFDDNGKKPEHDGAWLCRNSWGSTWAEEGYFWISYEDATLTEFWSFEAERADDYDNIYSHDGAAVSLATSVSKSANIFCTQGVEELKAVSFQTYSNYDYQIDIYAARESAMETPADGLLVYSQEGSLKYPGYHVIPLEKGVTLDDGMKYAVSVSLTSKDGTTVYTYVEKGSTYSAEAGQSFFYGTSGWQDTTADDYKNVTIKAFTDNVERVDKSELLSVIEEAEQLTSAEYTAASWAHLQEELSKARAVYTLSGATEHELIQAVLSLKEAVNTLVSAMVYVADEEEFEAFSKSVNSGNTYEGQTVCLLNDLDMTGVTHTAIGDSGNSFQGTFDGGGHVIANLTYSYRYSYGGLFGYIGEKGCVKNVSLLSAQFQLDSSYSGCLAGTNLGTISGCTVEGRASFDCNRGNLGGMVGSNEGTVENCHFKGTVSFTNQQSVSCFIGGLVGNNAGTISRCFMEGEIVSDGVGSTGGIVGWSAENSTVSQCYNLAAISGSPEGDTRTAGIGVVLAGTTSDCYNYGKLERTTATEFGAVYAYTNGTGQVSNCYYLNTSSSKGGYSPRFTSGSMTEEDFSSGKTAYYLNSHGGKDSNTYEWSQKDGAPILADSENKAVIKVTVRQDAENAEQLSLNGVINGEFYAKGGTEAELQVPEEVPGYLWSVEAGEMIPSEGGGNRYVLPDTDVEILVKCQKTAIDYSIIYHLNRGNGAEAGNYNIETSVLLPTPTRAKAEFLGWYENEACEGEPVREIPEGSTGDREFWAKWNHLGYEVIFPAKKGYEIASVDGYENGKIPEDGSYLFTVNVQEGYDASGMTIQYGENVLTPSDGMYRIDHILSDIDDITIGGVKLGSGHYAVESYQGYVGREAVIRPTAPATGIKRPEDLTFSESITVGTEEEVHVMTCDEEGTTSDPEVVGFRRDVTAPVISTISVVSAGDEKGVYLTVHADDSESGVSGYSFDGGETWQESNRYYVVCGETEVTFKKGICVRDYTGNMAEYTKQVIIPDHVFVDIGTIAGYTLSLKGNIGVNFYMELAGSVAGSDTAYMHFTLPNGTEKDVLVSEAVKDTTMVKGKTYYVFSCDVAAKEMTDEIRAQVMVPGDVVRYGKEYTYTVKQYADYLFQHKDNNATYEKAAGLIKSMLNYGSYAQKYFKHREETPANAGDYITEEEKDVSAVTADTLISYGNPAEQKSEFVKFEGSNLLLLSQTTLRLYFTVDETKVEDMVFTCIRNGEERELEKVKSGNYYYVEITDIAAKDLDETYTVTVSDSSSRLEVQYGVLAYCYNVLKREITDQRTQELKDVIAGLYLYNQEANRYFEK